MSRVKVKDEVWSLIKSQFEDSKANTEKIGKEMVEFIRQTVKNYYDSSNSILSKFPMRYYIESKLNFDPDELFDIMRAEGFIITIPSSPQNPLSTVDRRIEVTINIMPNPAITFVIIRAKLSADKKTLNVTWSSDNIFKDAEVDILEYFPSAMPLIENEDNRLSVTPYEIVIKNNLENRIYSIDSHELYSKFYNDKPWELNEVNEVNNALVVASTNSKDRNFHPFGSF